MGPKTPVPNIGMVPYIRVPRGLDISSVVSGSMPPRVRRPPAMAPAKPRSPSTGGLRANSDACCMNTTAGRSSRCLASSSPRSDTSRVGGKSPPPVTNGTVRNSSMRFSFSLYSLINPCIRSGSTPTSRMVSSTLNRSTSKPNFPIKSSAVRLKAAPNCTSNG